MTPIIVIPDGLRADGTQATPLAEPSFVYRAVLDHVACAYPNDKIYLAPANRFGLPCTEQEAGAMYLRKKGEFNLVAPPSPHGGHIDTRGNARELRRYLQRTGAWPLPPCIVVVAFRHATRARLCLEREGFVVSTVDAVPYEIPLGEKIIRRAWYYRYPLFHGAYEALALLRDWVRIGRPL